MSEIDHIETRVERDRAALARSLEALSDAADPSRMAARVSSLAQGYGGEIGRQAWDAARQNPAAFALVGAGIGLLLTGAGSRPERPRRSPAPAAVPPAEAMEGQHARMAAADARIRDEMTGLSEQAADASRLRATLSQGLGALPAGARKRVEKARRAALKAQERVEAHAETLAKHSRGVMNEQPLAVGAVALGMGALIGAMLPSTRREDALLGERRDAMMRAAQEALSEELARVHDAASSRLSDAVPGTGTKPPAPPTAA